MTYGPFIYFFCPVGAFDVAQAVEVADREAWVYGRRKPETGLGNYLEISSKIGKLWGLGHRESQKATLWFPKPEHLMHPDWYTPPDSTYPNVLHMIHNRR